MSFCLPKLTANIAIYMHTFLLFSFLSFIMIPEPIAAAVGGVVRMRRAKIWTKPENGVFHAHGDLIQEFI